MLSESVGYYTHQSESQGVAAGSTVKSICDSGVVGGWSKNNNILSLITLHIVYMINLSRPSIMFLFQEFVLFVFHFVLVID